MIIKASQRGGSKQLANHLLNATENEHVTVHEVSGFIAETIHDAFEEAHAVSKATQCQKYLLFLSLNPPQDEKVKTSTFENAVNRIEKKLGLEGQPRIVVFHEKQGRRHAHVVWSRIDGQDMKAIKLDYYKNRLMDIAKELYLENNWKMPQGFIDKELRTPLNFTQDQWQQAKRLGHDPRMIKAGLIRCWENSDSKKAFQQAMKEHGYYLAKGDRRGYVAVDWRGEVYSLSRWLGVKTKTLKERLGQSETLPSVSETKANIDQALVQKIEGFIKKTKQHYSARLNPLLKRKEELKIRHTIERHDLKRKQESRQQTEARERQDRLHKGVRGLWQRITGKRKSIIRQNEMEAAKSYVRDREEQDTLIQKQLDERQPVQQAIKHIEKNYEKEVSQIKEVAFSPVADNKHDTIKTQFEQQAINKQPNFDMEM